MEEGGLRRASSPDHRLLGFALGVAGAMLDFYSAYLLLAQPGMSPNGMEAAASSGGTAVVWGVGLAALGAVLAVTAILSINMVGIRSMKDSGGLMVVYGGAMLFVGVSMYSGITSMTQGAMFPALGMLFVGALMVANGLAMLRPRSM